MSLHEAITTPQPAKLSIEDFMTLDRAGAFDGYCKTELIDGTIYVVNAQYSEHMKAKVRLLRRLADACDALGNGMEAWSEGSVAMAPSSMPEPDLFITRETPTTGPVRIETVALVVEVSDTTLIFDMGQKAALYARQGIPEYWVADLAANRIVRMWTPQGEAYSQRDEWAFGARVESAIIAGLGVDTAGLK